MEKQDLVYGDKLGKLQFCENCVFGKSTRLKFKMVDHMTSGILNYIHLDLWGPSKHPTLGGALYFLSMIDEYSRKLWVYVLKTKGEAFQKFKE